MVCYWNHITHVIFIIILLDCESSGDDTPNTGDAEGVPLPLSILADGPLAMGETCRKSPQDNEHHNLVQVSA